MDAIKWAVQNDNASVARAIWAFLQTDMEVPYGQVFDVLVGAALQYSKYLPADGRYYAFCATTVSLQRFVNAELVKMPRTAAEFFELAGASKVRGDAP